MTQFWSCGGGTQSVAIATLIIQGRLPKPNASCIVDTGREKQSTWDYFETILKPNLAVVGVDLVRVDKDEFATCDLTSTNGESILVPAFSDFDDRPSKLPNWCSNEWKTRVADRWLRSQGIKETVKWIGFSLDEPKRYLKNLENPLMRFPLVQDVPMKRHDCRTLIASMGWPAAPRSACWMCPNMHDNEWREIIANRPSEFQKAVELEKELQGHDPHVWLHASCKPLSDVDFSQPPSLFDEVACDSGNCFI